MLFLIHYTNGRSSFASGNGTVGLWKGRVGSAELNEQQSFCEIGMADNPFLPPCPRLHVVHVAGENC